MRYLNFVLPSAPRQVRLGAMVGKIVIDLAAARTWAQGAQSISARSLPETLIELIHAGDDLWDYARSLVAALEGLDLLHLKGAGRAQVGYKMDDVMLLPPLLRPLGMRDFYAFEEHVRTAYKNRGRDIPEEWYQIPVFYFTNPNAIFGPDQTVPYPSHSKALDYELEVACVIGKSGRDIQAELAEEYIFGYTVFNDWSARDTQRIEMKVGLGPAKGKDFASSLGPWITTADELEEHATDRPGVYDLEMVARVNNVERSRGNWKDITYSFGDMIARASQDVVLLPGEVIGSGTVGSGSLLELTKGEGPWLQTGDIVELEIEKMGVLRNRVGAKKDNE
ncbi:MAG: fumarylacetoacetate hydrolase family protein [Chloroflexi bacterium]|nr:fumarylacetoacetate hydrolase family protein [Chloroflexota bacterium]